jgi:dihydromethanopterin reductase (acceptor)
MDVKRIAWVITGGGHFLEECIETALNCERVDMFLSQAAEEVLRMYKLDARITVPNIRIYEENKPSSPLVKKLFSGEYSVLVAPPATSNSVAKFVHGISDTLATNLFAQAGKSQVPVIVFPTDLAPEMDSRAPRGKHLKIYPRPIDLENTEKLKKFPGVTVVSDKGELECQIATYVKK